METENESEKSPTFADLLPVALPPYIMNPYYPYEQFVHHQASNTLQSIAMVVSQPMNIAEFDAATMKSLSQMVEMEIHKDNLEQIPVSDISSSSSILSQLLSETEDIPNFDHLLEIEDNEIKEDTASTKKRRRISRALQYQRVGDTHPYATRLSTARKVQTKPTRNFQIEKNKKDTSISPELDDVLIDPETRVYNKRTNELLFGEINKEIPEQETVHEAAHWRIQVDALSEIYEGYKKEGKIITPQLHRDFVNAQQFLLRLYTDRLQQPEDLLAAQDRDLNLI